MSDSFDPLQYERPFWQPIGQFVINFGYLERDVNWAVAALLQVHHRQGETVASQITSLRSRIRLTEKLAYLLTADASLRKRMTEISHEILKQNEYRNKLIYGPWSYYVTPSREEQGYWQKGALGPQDFKYKHFKVQLSELIDKIKHVQNIRAEFVNHVQAIVANRNEPVSSPDTPRQSPPKEDN